MGAAAALSELEIGGPLIPPKVLIIGAWAIASSRMLGPVHPSRRRQSPRSSAKFFSSCDGDLRQVRVISSSLLLMGPFYYNATGSIGTQFL